MSFEIGEHLMYGISGICVFKGLEEKSFGSENKRYLVLVPCGKEHSVYYVPEELAEKRLRRLMKKEEIYELIDSIPGIKPCDVGDKNRCKEIFSSVLKSDDSEKMISLMKSLYSKNRDKERAGKKLSSAEETVMKTAEDIIHQEFAIVLGIPKDEVKDLIAKRIG